MRGAGRLCRERPESFLAPREGNALSNFLRNDQMRRGGSRAGPEANALPHCAVESRRAASDKVRWRRKFGQLAKVGSTSMKDGLYDWEAEAVHG